MKKYVEVGKNRGKAAERDEVRRIEARLNGDMPMIEC
jgi:hypothetical protein